MPDRTKIGISERSYVEKQKKLREILDFILLSFCFFGTKGALQNDVSVKCNYEFIV